MSLDFNYADVADKDTYLWDDNDRMRPEAESIIWHTMFLGINKITADNYKEFYLRYLVYRTAMDQGEPFFKLRDVRGMIGLHTNASSITEAAFKKDMIATLIEKQQFHVDKELNEMGVL